MFMRQLMDPYKGAFTTMMEMIADLKTDFGQNPVIERDLNAIENLMRALPTMPVARAKRTGSGISGRSPIQILDSTLVNNLLYDLGEQMEGGSLSLDEDSFDSIKNAIENFSTILDRLGEQVESQRADV
jgi:hypothetical protein